MSDQTTEQTREAVEGTETVQQDQEQPQEAAQAPESTEEATEAQEDAQQQDRTPNAEAKRYRLKLRETEAALTEAQEQVQQLQDQLMQDALSGDFHLVPQTGNRATDSSGNPKARAMRLREPGDLFSVGGVDRGSLFSDDGTLDTVKLTQAVQNLHQQRPELFQARTGAVSTIGKQPEPHQPQRTWAHVLSGD